MLFAALLAAAVARAHEGEGESREEKIEIFLQHLGKVARVEAQAFQSLVLEHELARSLAELGAPHPEPPEGDFIRRALERLHPALAEAAAARREGRKDDARRQLSELATQSDPYLAAQARLELAELALAEGDPAQARRRAEEAAAKDRRFLLEDFRLPELLAQVFRAASKPLLEYLELHLLLVDYKDLPVEVEARAKSRLAELEEANGRPLSLVSGKMAEVVKLLDERQTAADPTQRSQEDVAEALAKLVELQEARERNT